MYKEKRNLLEMLVENTEMYKELMYLFKEMARKQSSAYLKLSRQLGKEGFKKGSRMNMITSLIPDSAVYVEIDAKINDFITKYQVDPNEIRMALSIFGEGASVNRYIRGREKSEKMKKKRS